MNANTPQELRITVTGRVPLPADLFGQARTIASVETHINAMKAAAGSLDGIDFRVDATVVLAGAMVEPSAGRPIGRKAAAPVPTPVPVAASRPVAPAATIIQDGRTRIPVYAADGTVFSSYVVRQNASVRLVELINACAVTTDLDALMNANEHVSDWPAALRDLVYNAAVDRESALIAAGRTGT